MLFVMAPYFALRYDSLPNECSQIFRLHHVFIIDKCALNMISVLIESFCGPLVMPDHVIVSPDACGKARVPVDTHCHMQCADGYVQSGPSDFLCIHGNGSPLWSPDAVPTCRGNFLLVASQHHQSSV